tara:strand:- start:268 stop:531 length:264 start_codon:yes stop_codon:yes gene_type:complete
MFKLINELNPKDKSLTNLAIFPGLYYNTDKPKQVKEIINITNKIIKDKEVISENIFIKFYGFIDNSNNKGTRKQKHSHKTNKSRKKK